MDVEHRLSFHADNAIQKQLRLIGVVASSGLNTVAMRESDRRWAALSYQRSISSKRRVR